ncbi:MAG: NDP-hexose 2,3-dehydratase family protein [Cyclobacteriaceae bacterium]
MKNDFMDSKVTTIISDSANLQISVSEWLETHRRNKGLKVEPILFSDCKQWEFLDGSLKHKTGRYFSIRGIRIESNVPYFNGWEQPVIHQPEVGILGFVIRQNKSGWDWLLQAKAEPGNVFIVQGAPTVQATKSNYERVHQGLPTPLIECFTRADHPGVTLLTNVEQSEQGDRFLNKYNRNCVALVSFDYPVPDNNLLKWFPANALRKVLLFDFTVNTDARSVLFCSNWQFLADNGGEPFHRWVGKGGFGEKLLHSFQSQKNLLNTLDDCIEKLEDVRESIILDRTIIPLSELSEWKIGAGRIFRKDIDSTFSIRVFDIHASDREVSYWCQPLLESSRTVNVVVICTSIAGILHFFLRLLPEPGFKESVQLAPSKIGSPFHLAADWVDDALNDHRSVHRAHVLQSDEGGRFMNAVVNYEIVEVSPKWADYSTVNGIWLTLGQLKSLAGMKGQLTNETRCALSLLLAWV